ncbi:hypothetical protein SAMD00023353_1101630 [Rosellinia necatrix]|uniref:Uncharacterized protein n=1 Tax=Rosellinia necatrix TaxID=77044 RepID=A0A1S8A6J7_ROSNE|nr:hypothetical protein SAMD00023353_1101630 [Rosellinia necatrix]
MQILGALNEPSVITARTQELSSKSIPPSKDPETPELEQQGPSRSRFGLPTPDTTPEHQRVTPGDRSRQAFVHLHGLQDAGQLTPSTSSEAHSTDDEDHHSLYLIHSEEPSGHPSLPPTAALSPRKTESHLSLSVLRSVYKSVVGFLNLAKKRTSRADDARVQGTIDLIKSIPTIRRTRVGNLTRKLTVKQYGQLLRVIEGYEDDNFRAFFQDKLRFDYTRQTQQFEIRMPTNVHEEVGDFIMDKLSIWRHSLELSIVPKVSNAAKTVKPSGSTDVQFSFTRGENDSKSPDRSVRHKQCERQCKNPTMLMEFAWSQEKENVREKAEAYM